VRRMACPQPLTRPAVGPGCITTGPVANAHRDQDSAGRSEFIQNYPSATIGPLMQAGAALDSGVSQQAFKHGLLKTGRRVGRPSVGGWLHSLGNNPAEPFCYRHAV
jgi:hypothetical protein